MFNFIKKNEPIIKKKIDYKNEISLSILNCDFTSISKLIKKINNSKKIKWLHYDVMDGHFVNKISFGNNILESLIKKIKIPVEVHLMVSNPDKLIKRFVKTGAKLIIVSFESLYYREIKNILLKIKNCGVRAGIAISPKTNIEQIYEYLEYIDEILIMAVFPGKGGQLFIENTYSKIEKIKNYFILKKIKHICISIDGGINLESGKKCFMLGANKLVIGSYLIKADNFDEKCLKNY